MKFTNKLLFESTKSLHDKLNRDPTMIRKRMEKEPELEQSLKNYVEMICGEKFDDNEVRELVLSAVFYGFCFREELLIVKKEKK